MIVHMPGPSVRLLFASRSPGSPDGDRELSHWAEARGYADDLHPETFAIYKNGRLVREWRLLERLTGPTARPGRP